MEIRDIKERLSITVVLGHYGLKPDKHNRLNCPFHEDKTPSLQIYPATNTYCCFSSNCTAGTGDVIQFIQLKENCTKHEALLKAQQLIGDQPLPPITPPTTTSTKLFIETSSTTDESTRLEKIAVLTKLFSYFTKALPLTKKAVAYLESRSIKYQYHEIGYNSGDWHHKLKESHFIAACVKYGLLKPNPKAGYNAWAKDCIIFPLKDKDNKIVSLYGRSITNDHDQRHFYLAGREGLYPQYPKQGARKLIITESIIDTASVLQDPDTGHRYNALPLYGTNGLTEEHIAAIKPLQHLEEIILMLNADKAGKAATEKHAHTLRTLQPHARIMHVALPEGEDVNSLLQGHDAKLLRDLLRDRKEFFLSIEAPEAPIDSSVAASEQSARENKKSFPVIIDQPSEVLTAPELQPITKLNTNNPELLIYDNCELYMEILGGIKITGLDRMKVTLKVKHKERVNHPQWYSLDLYNQAQREQAINSVAEILELSTQQTTQTFIDLITELENYRIKRIEALQPKEKPAHELTGIQRQTAVNELKKPKLLQRTGQLLRECGIVGEENNSLIAYLIYTVRKQSVPLHVMFLGSSGSGKTYLQERISELIPEEDKIEITQITENALYYFKQHELQHKLILIEDLDGAMTVFYPLRELQTKRRISKTVTLKDSKGNLKTITLTVEGPVCVSGCTTKEKIYEDNANRCILLYTDQTRDQDKRINEYQTKLSAGEVNKERENQYRELFKHMQRVLVPIHIINPYAKWIALPEEVFKPRRTMTLLLGFIEAVTFYHQYQREVKKDAASQPYIETTIDDIESAFNLLKDVLFAKSDELSKATRDFLEQLKQLSKVSGNDTFHARSIREQLRINPGNMKRYLSELVRYGYIKASGNRYKKGSYEYTIVNASEYEALKSRVEQHMQTILRAIKDLAQKPVSSSVVQ